MIKRVISLLLAIQFTGSVMAQERKKIDIWNPPVQKGIKSLNVGDALPDFKMKLFNDSREYALTSDYKDKLVIFDFGNTGCGGCIAALPLMDSLQKAFAGQVKIFWVTPEYKEDLEKFWNRKNNKYTKNNGIAVVTEDSVARAYFKHRSWPHEVWIYKGKVIGITGPDYVSSENIKLVLSGSKIDWPVKNDFYVFDGTKQSLFKPDSKQVDTAGTFIKYAAISDYKEGVNSEGLSGGSGIVRDALKKTVRAFFLNQPVYNSYVIGWMNAGPGKLVKPDTSPVPGKNEVSWEVADKSKYFFVAGKGYQQDWLRKHGICYESVNPDTGQTDQQVYRAMISDLDRLLGLRGRWEKRKEKVLVLSGKGNSLLKSKRAVAPEDHVITKGRLHLLRDTPVGTLTWNMNLQETNPYVFDESSYKGKVDMNFDISSWTDIAGIRKALLKYGLELKTESRKIDRFVLKEIDGGMLVDREMQRQAKKRKSESRLLKDPSAAENIAFMEVNKTKPGVVTLPSGLQYKVLKKGTGIKPAANDKVTVQYTGMLVNGKIFDSSFERGKPAVFNVNEVIEGWTAALQLMPVGSKWIIYVPSKLAYAEHTNSGQIPRNSNLIFELELLKVNK